MEHYDLCVIGGGPAGYAAAMRAVDLGRRTVLIEREHVGGTGIFNGALASKTLWELGQRVSQVNAMVRNRDREPFRLSWSEIERILGEAIFERKYLYACHLQLLKQSHADRFTHLRGSGRFTGPTTVEVERGDGLTTVSADHFIVATGSRPRQLPTIPVDERHILSSDGIFNISDLPESIVIIGAGVIGCEFATILSDLGHTRVHLIDRAERILPFEDADVSETVALNLERKGVIIHHGARLEHIEAAPEGVRYRIVSGDGRVEELVVEKALVSVGRVPNLEGLGLERTGIELQSDTGIPVLRDTCSSLPHIHVVGDAMGSNMLVNLGEMEGRNAVERLFGQADRPVSYENISTIMFLDPEVAGVGPNEQECRKQGIAHRVARIDYSCLARAIAMRRTKGFFKLIVSDDDRMQVLGMRAVGEHASSAIQAVALLMRTGHGIRELAELAHPHPSITEGVQECARMLLGTSMFKSAVFGDRMRCYVWRPEAVTVAA